MGGGVIFGFSDRIGFHSFLYCLVTLSRCLSLDWSMAYARVCSETNVARRSGRGADVHCKRLGSALSSTRWSK